MKFKKYLKGGIITFIGYLLSPLSFWNDLFLNIPIAYFFSWLVAFFISGIFLESIIFFYWVTNILGLLMMHYGIKGMVSKQTKLNRKDLIINLLVSIAYTLIIYFLVIFNILKLPNFF